MNLLYMAWRSLRARPGITVLTVLSVALGTALVCSVLTLHSSSRKGFNKEISSFDMVVGSKGSGLQLVLCTLYHLDDPTGNIRYDTYQAISTNRWVRDAVPIALGDNIEGFRIIGTEPHLFEITRRGEKEPMFQVGEGRLFDKPFEAVLGSEVAAQTGFKIGDTFAGTHGLVKLTGGRARHDEFPYTVVGIMKSGGMAADRGVYTSLDSVWQMHEYEALAHAEDLEGREVTAVLARLNTLAMRLKFMEEVNKETEAMAVSPVLEMHRLKLNLIEPLQQVLLLVAGLVILVASLAVLATLLQAAEQRRRDRAVLRALGAYPAELFILVMLEALITVTLGMALGVLLGHGVLAIFGDSIRTQMGMQVSPWGIGSREGMALLLIFASGAVAGIIPAAMHYRRSPVGDLKQG